MFGKVGSHLYSTENTLQGLFKKYFHSGRERGPLNSKLRRKGAIAQFEKKYKLHGDFLELL